MWELGVDTWAIVKSQKMFRTGIEPLTSWLPVRCSNHWATETEMESEGTTLINSDMNIFQIFHWLSFHLWPQGIAGASLTYALTPEASRSNTTLGDTVLSVHISTIQGLFIEFLLTFILTLAVYAAKDPGRSCRGYDVSLAYGFAVMVCHFVGVSLLSWFSNSLIIRKPK